MTESSERHHDSYNRNHSHRRDRSQHSESRRRIHRNDEQNVHTKQNEPRHHSSSNHHTHRHSSHSPHSSMHNNINRSIPKEVEHKSQMWVLVDSSDDETPINNVTSVQTTSNENQNKTNTASNSHHHEQSHRHSSMSSRSPSISNDRNGAHRHRRHHRRHHRSSQEKESSDNLEVDINDYGKHGIISEKDYTTKQREFEMWLRDIHNINSIPSDRLELMKLFRAFCSSFNTCSFPSDKYYDLYAFELKHARKNSDDDLFKITPVSVSKKQEDEINKAWYQMKGIDNEKLNAMDRQNELIRLMQAAYNRGDMERVEEIKKLITPDKAEDKEDQNML